MNYVGDHPSNLVGRVTIATSASSTPRAAICRSLLHSNAFVLGVDSSPAHSTTVASIGSHFQFLQYDAERGLNGRKAVGKVKMAYQKDEVDFMVHIGEGGRVN
ncbi:hypothetical protein BDZ45DRAFT_754408 [Acephala macrosclerotiorum]|nr:hypothetical protein BDZ45DRAFT_754408 [Acephala macrosclerotiorum]